MRKQLFLGVFFGVVVVCTTSVSLAQSVRYKYTGPLDRLETVPLKDIIIAEPSYRVTRLEPLKKLRMVHPGVSSAVIGRITTPAKLAPPRQITEIAGQVESLSPSNQIIGEALPLDRSAPTFDAPPVQSDMFQAEVDFNGEDIQQARPGYADPLSRPAEDPTRFGYHDGKSFGFENTRLYNPLEGPQLNLQGAPTAFLGAPGCDEWANFCQNRDLDQVTDCGGLKAKPGHLGLPWLGSKDNCDQTVPLFKNRNRGCQKCGATKNCKSCESCSECTISHR